MRTKYQRALWDMKVFEGRYGSGHDQICDDVLDVYDLLAKTHQTSCIDNALRTYDRHRDIET